VAGVTIGWRTAASGRITTTTTRRATATIASTRRSTTKRKAGSTATTRRDTTKRRTRARIVSVPTRGTTAETSMTITTTCWSRGGKSRGNTRRNGFMWDESPPIDEEGEEEPPEGPAAPLSD
jgi:hypothetical protein